MANYLKYINEESTIYEDEYVDGSDVEITFPSQKRNLIYIFFGIDEYSCAAEPPVRGGVSHLSRRNEPL